MVVQAGCSMIGAQHSRRHSSYHSHGQHVVGDDRIRAYDSSVAYPNGSDDDCTEADIDTVLDYWYAMFGGVSAHEDIGADLNVVANTGFAMNDTAQTAISEPDVVAEAYSVRQHARIDNSRQTLDTTRQVRDMKGRQTSGKALKGSRVSHSAQGSEGVLRPVNPSVHRRVPTA